MARTTNTPIPALLQAIAENVTPKNSLDEFWSSRACLSFVRDNWDKVKDTELGKIDFSHRLIYLAQPMTGEDKPGKDHWIPVLKKKVVDHNARVISLGDPSGQKITVLDPWLFEVGGREADALPPHLWACLDYALVNASALLVLDLTKGKSVGATCEAMCALSRKTEVLTVVNETQGYSPFVTRHFQPAIPWSPENSEGLAEWIVSKVLG